MKQRTLFLFILVLCVLFSGCNGQYSKVEITGSIDKYTPAMSSVPGFPLEAVFSKDRPKDAVFEWKTDNGVFLKWGDDMVVTSLGNDTEYNEGRIYWSPLIEDNPLVDSALITLTVRILGSDEIYAIDSKWIRLDSDGLYRIIDNKLK